MTKISSINLKPIPAVKLAVASSGYKYKNRDDLLLILLEKDSQVAGVFTKSACPSAPVEFCRNNLTHGVARALLVNAGNANAFTGKQGQLSVNHIAKALVSSIDCDISEIFLASTGVIGEFLDPDPIVKLLPSLLASADSDAWLKAAEAIRTTDAFAKYSSYEFDYEGEKIIINAIAKGAGMIAPDMATMLCFAATNAAIDAELAQKMLNIAVQQSFNNITVDSDSSTSDSVLLFTAGGAGRIKDGSHPMAEQFQIGLNKICKDLALQIVGDGEGAKHLIRVEVTKAASDESARKIALSIANSPLVKTAIAGEDANWGRVVMAIGKAGEPADRDKLEIYFGQYCVAEQGARALAYDERKLSEYMKNRQIDIRVNLNLGQGKAEIWGCDLTPEYVAINADYRS